MKVPLETGDSVPGAWSATAAPEEINLTPPSGYEARFTQPVAVRLDVRRVGEEFFLEGQAETPVTYTCVRCLSEFAGHVTTELSLIIHRVTAPTPQTAELEAYVEVPLGTPEYEIGSYVREALLLAACASGAV